MRNLQQGIWLCQEVLGEASWKLAWVELWWMRRLPRRGKSISGRGVACVKKALWQEAVRWVGVGKRETEGSWCEPRMLRHMGPALWRVGPLSLKLGRAVSPGTALALYLRMIPLTAMGTIRSTSNLNEYKPLVNCPHSSILPTAPGIIDLIFVSHDRHWKGNPLLLLPLIPCHLALFPEIIVPVLPPSTLIPHALPFVLFSLHVWAWERNAEPAEGSGRQMENDY